MFWSKKPKKTDKQKKLPAKTGSSASYGDVGNKKGQRSSEDIRAEALANIRAARERIGDETIQKIADALVKKQMSLTEQAKAKIAKANSERVSDEIRLLLEDKEKK